MAKMNPRLAAAKKAQKSQGGPVGYVKNIGKEVKDTVKAFQAAQEMSNRVGAGTDAAANRLRRKADAEQGQLLGAILQGRRYDAKGNQIKAKKK